MLSDLILAIIFILILGLAAVLKLALRRPVAAKSAIGAGALFLMGVAYALQNTTIPLWLLGLSGILILADAWLSRKKTR